MVTITLPPELEKVVTERAKRQGTTPELWTLDRLTQSLQAEAAVEPAPEPTPESGSMLDFFEGYIGVLDSSEFVKEGWHENAVSGRTLPCLPAPKGAVCPS